MLILLVILLQFHGPGGQTIWVNPETVTSVREPKSDDHFGHGVRCIINMDDGKFAAVTEDCEEVKVRGERK